MQVSFPALFERNSGTLHLFYDRVEFVEQGSSLASVVILNPHLRLRLAGQNDHYFVLNDLMNPHLGEITVHDPGFIEELSRRGHSEATKILADSKRKTSLRRALIGLPIVLLVLGILILPFAISYLPANWLTQLVSRESEQKLGEALLPLLTDEADRGKEGSLQSELETVVGELQKANPELKELKLRLFTSETKEANAAALPGDIIVVNRGLIHQADSTDEIAGVLAHEIGHIKHRHSLKRVVSGLGSTSGFIILGLFVGFDAAGVAASGVRILDLKYSRTDELEADREASRILANAGMSTNGLIGFFNRMATRQESLGGAEKAIALISTHPLSADRIAALKVLETKTEIRPQAPSLPSIEVLKAAR